jgi:Tfp pilus assembly protein PilF
MRDHDEHLEWAKARAREYLDRGDHANAVTSIMSDLAKHPDWSQGHLLAAMAMLYMVEPHIETARRIVEGFR